MADPERRLFRERALRVALAWLVVATVHRLAILGRYHVGMNGIFGRNTLGLEGRLLPLALANGIATDLCSFTLLVGPALVIAHLGQRGPRPVRVAAAALPWVASGLLSLGLVFNFLSFRHTNGPLDFLFLSNFSQLGDLLRFLLVEAGGTIRLLLALALGGAIPFAVSFAADLVLRKKPPLVSWRATVLLIVVVLAYGITSPSRGSAITSEKGRVQFTLIREYEDPAWRVATGAVWAWRSPTVRREITQQEFQFLRPVLTPGDTSPAVDPRYPLFRSPHDERERVIDVGPPGEPPNVVLILLEGNGTADIGAFGDAGGLTPCFDGLAKDGLLFENYYATASDSVGAFYSILWSGYPAIDAARTYLLPVRGSLPEILQSKGYAAVTVADDWNKLSDLSRGTRFEGIQVGKKSWGDDRIVFGRALEATAKLPEPFLLTVFTMTHHSPWVVPDGSGKGGSEWERSRETLAYQDRALCEFVTSVRARETGSRRTLFVLAGDHGSHIPVGGITELAGLPEFAVHVPLLVYSPGWIPASRSEILGGHVDVLPTILDLVGIDDAQNAAVGSSLLRGGQKRIFLTNSVHAGFIGLIRGDRKLAHDIYRGGTSIARLGTDDPDEAPDSALVEHMLTEAFLVNRFATWLVMRAAVAPASDGAAAPP